MTMKKKEHASGEQHGKRIPEAKVKLVQELAEKIKNSKTVLIASMKGLPGSQFHEIKKNLRGKAEIQVAKKSIVLRALAATEKGVLQTLKQQIGSDIALFFSDLEAFELSALLNENQSPARAKAGDVAPKDVNVEPGPTDLIPGPAISELSSVGLKVAVEGGKLTIKHPATIVKKGEVIKEHVASVMVKLNIFPMNVGFEPLAAYDAVADKVYVNITVDKKKTLEELRDSLKRALGFAIAVKYASVGTMKYFIHRAALEEKALQIVLEKSQQTEQGGSHG